MKMFIYAVSGMALALTSTVSMGGTLPENVDSLQDRAISLKVNSEVLHPISPMLFGQFMEDGKHPNGGGEWGPQSTEALNDDGSLRTNVRDLLAELHAPIIRFPGGFMIENANQRYDYRIWLPGQVEGLWLEESVPLKLERRRYGLTQFFATCERLDAEPLVVVPTKPVFQGQWTVEQAAEFAAGLVAFSNVDTPVQAPEKYRAWVDTRRRAGQDVSAGVKYWQIGNEIWYYKRTMQKRWREEAEQRGVDPAEVNPLTEDASWFDLQLKLVNAMSQAMRAVDPDIRVITDGMSEGEFTLQLVALEPGADLLADHRYMPWKTDGKLIRGKGESAEMVPVEALSAEEHFLVLVSTPGFDEEGRSWWAYRQGHDRHHKPMAFTEWNWNGWGQSVRGHPEIRPGWAQAIGAAGFIHAIMRRGDRAVIACQSMMLGNDWEITAVRVGEGHEPFIKPTGRVTGFYSRHHGSAMLAVDDRDVPRYEQPYRMGQTLPAARVARIDTLATAGEERVYVHLIHRSFDKPSLVKLSLADVVPAEAKQAELRLLLGRTDIDLGDPAYAAALIELDLEVELDRGIAEFELPAQALAVLIAPVDPQRLTRTERLGLGN